MNTPVRRASVLVRGEDEGGGERVSRGAKEKKEKKSRFGGDGRVRSDLVLLLIMNGNDYLPKVSERQRSVG